MSHHPWDVVLVALAGAAFVVLVSVFLILTNWFDTWTERKFPELEPIYRYNISVCFAGAIQVAFIMVVLRICILLGIP